MMLVMLVYMYRECFIQFTSTLFSLVFVLTLHKSIITTAGQHCKIECSDPQDSINKQILWINVAIPIWELLNPRLFIQRLLTFDLCIVAPFLFRKHMQIFTERKCLFSILLFYFFLFTVCKFSIIFLMNKHCLSTCQSKNL